MVRHQIPEPESSMQLRDLSDLTAVVTGASSGIGAAAARALIAEGMNVVLSARSVDKLNALAEELGERASVMVADVADRGQVARLFSFAKERHGGGGPVVQQRRCRLCRAFRRERPCGLAAYFRGQCVRSFQLHARGYSSASRSFWGDDQQRRQCCREAWSGGFGCIQCEQVRGGGFPRCLA